MGSSVDFVDPGPLSQAAALAVSAFGILLAIQYNDIARDAMDKAEDISERIFDIEKDITDHWILNQHPHIFAVLGEIYGYSPPAANYPDALATSKKYNEALGDAVQAGVDVNEARYGVCGRADCNQELALTVNSATVDFTQQLMRHQERREERQIQEHIHFSTAAYRASRENPDDIFSLLRNAQNTYANIYNAATQGEAGAIGLIGHGIGTFIGGFFNT